MSLVVFIDVLLGVISGCFLGIFVFILYCKNRKPRFMKEILFEDNKANTTQDCGENIDACENESRKKSPTKSDLKEIDAVFLESIYDSKCRGADILFEQQEISELASSKTIDEYFDKQKCGNNADPSEKFENYHDNEKNFELEEDSTDGQLSFDELMRNNTQNKANSVITPKDKNNTKFSSKRIIIATNDNNKSTIQRNEVTNQEPRHRSKVPIIVISDGKKNKKPSVSKDITTNTGVHDDDTTMYEKEKIEIIVPAKKCKKESCCNP